MAKKVVVGMSGGVDSSVSAYLLKEQGYDVVGLFMKNWEEDDTDTYCSAAADLADARAVCDKIGIELKTINFAAEYWDRVFENFLQEYGAGRTPNPDILCNKEIKFKAFLDYAFEDLDADYIATGHYVRRTFDEKPKLLRGTDPNKDQSYFLYTLGYEQVGKSLFPVGDIIKPEVRKIAAKLGLATATKKDSTGICFIGEKRFNEFLSRFLPAKAGNIETVDGKVIGRHDGLMYHTLGQRKGLGIGGMKDSCSDEPWYVVDKDLKRNVLIVAQGHNHPRLMSRALIASNLCFNSREPIPAGRYTVKTRYRQPDIPCTVEQTDDDKMIVIFDHDVAAVTPGQSAVIYNGEECLGGGIIQERLAKI